MSPKRALSPLYTVLLLILAVVILESIITFIIDAFLPRITPTNEALLDSNLLMLSLLPVIYFLIFRPLVVEIGERTRLERWHEDLVNMTIHDLKNPLTGVVSSSELFLSARGG
jgi:flagellin-like protein